MLKLPTTPFFMFFLSVMGGLHGVCHHNLQDRIIISSSLDSGPSEKTDSKYPIPIDLSRFFPPEKIIMKISLRNLHFQILRVAVRRSG